MGLQRWVWLGLEVGRLHSRGKEIIPITHCPLFSILRAEVFKDWSVSLGHLLKMLIFRPTWFPNFSIPENPLESLSKPTANPTHLSLMQAVALSYHLSNLYTGVWKLCPVPGSSPLVHVLRRGLWAIVKLAQLMTRTTALSNSIKLWTMPCRATQDRRVMVESSDKTWSSGEGNGKPLQYSCLENPMNSMKRQKDITLKDELPRWVGAQCATGEEGRNNFRNNEKMEPKRKQCPTVDVTGDGSKK